MWTPEMNFILEEPQKNLRKQMKIGAIISGLLKTHLNPVRRWNPLHNAEWTVQLLKWADLLSWSHVQVVSGMEEASDSLLGRVTPAEAAQPVVTMVCESETRVQDLAPSGTCLIALGSHYIPLGLCFLAYKQKVIVVILLNRFEWDTSGI